ncbi:SRPBCC family protein [Azospirillum aestuarii]|uniref:SRPBCC family protein n=1 Tax=Azospirillum aestuarii TaxID=2802052 RepID=UPI001FFED147|nr:SRPBCC family protein [Azospirillum aestuarii]
MPYPVEKVWQQIGPFCNLGTWHPAVESCTLRRNEGAQERVLALKGGGAIEERLLSSSASSHRIRYSILTGPLPVKDYAASLSAEPAGRGARVVWTAHYTSNSASDEETRKVISGIFTAGFDGLKQKLAAR